MKKDDKEVLKLMLLLAGGLVVSLVLHLCVVYLRFN
jgi:hypothetical protein